MTIRTAESKWQGSLKDGKGSMAFGSGAYEGAYSFASRFESAPGTNPEELIAAAHSGCFAMALSGDLGRAGKTPTSIRVEAKVHLNPVDGAPTINRIDLIVEAAVPGIDQAEFEKIAEGTKANCPVSRALKAVGDVTLTAKLL